MKKTFTVELEKVGLSDIDLVGGKNASLGEMISGLSRKGIKVPGGFAVTVEAYKLFLEHNNLTLEVKRLLDEHNLNKIPELVKVGKIIRNKFLKGKFPLRLKNEILGMHKIMQLKYPHSELDLAVRSSATAEDLPNASFAGQQETFLNVRGGQELLKSVKKCFASLFTDRAISYRESNGFGHLDVYLSVVVQKMVRSDVGTSGVAFSIDPESGFKDAVVINGAYGLGELLVQGKISPDEYIVFKPTLEKGFDSIVEKKLGSKEEMLVYSEVPGELVKSLVTPQVMRDHFCLHNSQILKLAKWVIEIEKYYSIRSGNWCPVDIEWAVDGNTKELFIVQARPETIHSQKNKNEIINYKLNEKVIDENEALLKGIAVGDKIGSGKCKVLLGEMVNLSNFDSLEFKPGDVLVTEMTDPDWEPLMKIASAIVTNKGGRTCHAAIVARELGVPAIVGTENATRILKNNQKVTVSCCEGEVGKVYKGDIEFEKVVTKISDLPKVSTSLMLNVASPEMAFKHAMLPHSGVGLAREEFIINNYIKVHPLALLNHKSLGDKDLTKKINDLIRGYEDEESFFIEKLSQGIAKIAAAFYPEEVIVRFSDFKSNEYANLLGGKYYEPNEENPMIGWRGASRYYSDSFKPAFGMECAAIKKVRDNMGLDNVVTMIPFCRTVQECEKVLVTMSEFGLSRGVNGLKVYLMAELPSNIILAEQFADHIDGFSIGSNDLTQLTLGLDRDSHLVSHLYDERNDAVKFMIAHLIEVAHRKKVKVGICGQAPSDFPEFAAFLVEKGIDSISITPDSILKTLKSIKNIEDDEQSSGLSKVA